MPKLTIYWSIFDLPEKKSRLSELEKLAENPDLWENREKAQGILKKIVDLREEINDLEKLKLQITDSHDLALLGDESIRPDLERELVDIEHKLGQLELSTLLSEEYDHGNALLAIHAGAGGTDSQDWAEMLERMYLRWAEKNNFKAEILDRSVGEEAGIKSVTIAIDGRYAYGYLKSEKGVHRLVRLSPFDAAHRRHTSFAQVEILPDIDQDNMPIDVPQEDVRIDIFKSSGAGGQNVQKNSTAIRLLHIPTGIIVTCQNERSQLQNRENAFRVLKAKLLEIRRVEQEKELSKLRGVYQKAEWGSQIRSYVLHPYQLAKDHRTEFEAGNVNAVLDGDLNGFIEAYLKYNIE
ncbi:MAG: peptide chain release factor 2 [Chloroflexi bacterium HGW-Chloroflexi-2]|nr:MAG: peptide chain release factor 2 [Chloroflexi bacterium HGW-Chloroflexi-2]